MPVVPCLGQFTVDFLQSVGQDKHFIDNFLHTKPGEGFTIELSQGKDTNLSAPVLSLFVFLLYFNFKMSFATQIFAASNAGMCV